MRQDPFLRPLSPDDAPAPCPPGMVAEPAGTWSGRHMEVVYDPRRHDVAFTRGEPTGTVTASLAATGWACQRSDGQAAMWVRDRLALARRRLEHAAARPSPPRVA